MPCHPSPVTVNHILRMHDNAWWTTGEQCTGSVVNIYKLYFSLKCRYIDSAVAFSCVHFMWCTSQWLTTAWRQISGKYDLILSLRTARMHHVVWNTWRLHTLLCLWHVKERSCCKIHLLACGHTTLHKIIHRNGKLHVPTTVCYFARNQMMLVAMDTSLLYNQHILWQLTEKEKYPSYLDAKHVAPLWHFFAFCMWLNTWGSLSFSGSYSGTKHVYSAPSAQFIRCILHERNATLVSP